jgi:hypothetical protein
MRRALGAGAVHAYAAVGATYALLGLGAQSCGVMVSSDCVQRLICSHDDGSSEVPDSPDVLAAAGDDSDAAPASAMPDGDAGVSSESMPDAQVRGAPNDGKVDTGMDSEAQGDGDAGADVSVDVGIDTGADGGRDAGNETGVGPGPSCPASSGGFDTCNTGEHCCVDAPARAATCASTCDTVSYPVDCPGASGPGGCGSQSCCGTLVYDGGSMTTNCYVPKLTAGCADTCNDNFPATVAMCRGSFTVRLCTAAADCAGSANGSIYCCNFGNPPNSFNWCVAGTLLPPIANSCVP